MPALAAIESQSLGDINQPEAKINRLKAAVQRLLTLALCLRKANVGQERPLTAPIKLLLKNESTSRS